MLCPGSGRHYAGSIYLGGCKPHLSRGKNRTARLGGAGNVAANLSGIRCRVLASGIIGKDSAGDELLQLLEESNITGHCIRTAALPTVTKTRIMGGQQQVVRIDDEYPEGVSPELRDKMMRIVKGQLNDIGAVVISDYGKGLLTPDLIQSVITLCRSNHIPVFVDPKKNDWSAYAGATCITPNLKEFCQTCEQMQVDTNNIDSAAVEIQARWNLEYLLLTQGSAGMNLYNNQAKFRAISSRAREVFDVSGAGDTVIALAAAGIAAGCPMEDAVEIANLGAGMVGGRVGTYAITLPDLERACTGDSGNGQSTVSPLSQAEKLVEHWRMIGQKIVFTNGCFDIIHPGHISLLQQAAQLGDKLIVGLNTDNSIHRIKGPDRPIVSETDRAAILAALDSVDLVVLFDEDTPINLIDALRPDILVKGGDYTPATVVGADLLTQWGGRVEIVPIIQNKSTTAIVNKIHNRSLQYEQ